MRRLSVPLLRDLVMLGLGSGGMIHELFLTEDPHPVRVAVSLVLLSGAAAVNAWWLARYQASLPPTSPTDGPRRSSPSHSLPRSR